MVLEEQDFIKMRRFPLAYRWTDSRFWKASKTHLEQIRPISPDTATQLWVNLCGNMFGETLTHPIVELQLSSHDGSYQIEENQKHDVVKWLRFNLPNKPNQIAIFWEPAMAVLTNRNLFVNHWDNFCYPSSDDVFVWPLNVSWLLHYHHEEVFLLKKSS